MHNRWCVHGWHRWHTILVSDCFIYRVQPVNPVHPNGEGIEESGSRRKLLVCSTCGWQRFPLENIHIPLNLFPQERHVHARTSLAPSPRSSSSLFSSSIIMRWKKKKNGHSNNAPHRAFSILMCVLLFFSHSLSYQCFSVWYYGPVILRIVSHLN